ncbi:hypothetical protein DQ04_02641010 [Trypanosoma grayi]|uniref:hypothetical protein n=1 Tax=Trypanosoma grayi TaxID=71804 RepID=UPI0004F414DB|nr:hypothetical protein DQ04_02641010 [Trypanosoma grayi]KEG11414.1 hypothetical protein DQ04_02641010 [Trypanosoma grayi]
MDAVLGWVLRSLLRCSPIGQPMGFASRSFGETCAFGRRCGVAVLCVTRTRFLHVGDIRRFPLTVTRRRLRSTDAYFVMFGRNLSSCMGTSALGLSSFLFLYCPALSLVGCRR